MSKLTGYIKPRLTHTEPVIATGGMHITFHEFSTIDRTKRARGIAIESILPRSCSVPVTAS
eukprot:SAG31_NODE_31275_length_370_cov_0.575646_1_plen_61_part_00